jgi:hypothetical protein
MEQGSGVSQVYPILGWSECRHCVRGCLPDVGAVLSGGPGPLDQSCRGEAEHVHLCRLS